MQSSILWMIGQSSLKACYMCRSQGIFLHEEDR